MTLFNVTWTVQADGNKVADGEPVRNIEAESPEEAAAKFFLERLGAPASLGRKATVEVRELGQPVKVTAAQAADALEEVSAE